MAFFGIICTSDFLNIFLDLCYCDLYIAIMYICTYLFVFVM